jgi:hypothetical protein
VFTSPTLAFTMSDLGVHVAPIHAFTFDRYAQSDRGFEDPEQMARTPSN